jgi:hypothetical protein
MHEINQTVENVHIFHNSPVVFENKELEKMFDLGRWNNDADDNTKVEI